MPEHKVTPRLLQDMQRMRANGETYRAITRRFNLSIDTVYKWLNPEYKTQRNQYHAQLASRRR